MCSTLGAIPASIGELSSLTKLRLDNNQLKGRYRYVCVILLRYQMYRVHMFNQYMYIYLYT